jgi:hypothetical protein
MFHQSDVHMTSQKIAVVACFVWFAIATRTNAETFSFVPGNYYSTKGLYRGGAHISEHNQPGQMVAERGTNKATDFGRLAFGPDANLYVEAYHYDGRVVTEDLFSLNENMQIQQRYQFPAGLQKGEILFDDAGHLYWGNAQFDIGNPDSGRRFLPQDVSLQAILPNGNYLVTRGLTVCELDATRTSYREIFRPQRPQDWVGNVAYDSQTNTVFVSGGMDGDYRIKSLNFDTGAVLASTNFYTSDLFITREGLLLASSFSLHPTLFTRDLIPVLTLSGYPYGAITQFIPEPTSWALALSGLGFLTLCRKRIERSQ